MFGTFFIKNSAGRIFIPPTLNIIKSNYTLILEIIYSLSRPVSMIKVATWAALSGSIG